MLVVFTLSAICASDCASLSAKSTSGGLLGALTRMGAGVHRAAKIGAGIVVAKPIALGILGKCKRMQM